MRSMLEEPPLGSDLLRDIDFDFLQDSDATSGLGFDLDNLPPLQSSSGASLEVLLPCPPPPPPSPLSACMPAQGTRNHAGIESTAAVTLCRTLPTQRPQSAQTQYSLTVAAV